MRGKYNDKYWTFLSKIKSYQQKSLSLEAKNLKEGMLSKKEQPKTTKKPRKCLNLSVEGDFMINLK